MRLEIDIPDPDELLASLVHVTRATENSRPDAQAARATTCVRGFIDYLTAEAIDASERQAFDTAWAEFSTSYTFDDDTEKNQQRNGFIEGWARARKALGEKTILMTAAERRDHDRVADDGQLDSWS